MDCRQRLQATYLSHVQVFCSRDPSCELQGYGATFPGLHGGGSCVISLPTVFALRLGVTQEGRCVGLDRACP